MFLIKPKIAWLTTNRNCNNKCNWCYTYNYNCRKLSMDYEKVKKYIDKLAEMEIKKIVLIGGEPTIYKKVVELIQYINEKNISISMASNGRRFSDIEFAKNCKKAGLDYVNISIKGISEDEYVKNTNSFGYNEMLKGYRNLKTIGIRTSLSYVIIHNNKKEYENLKKMLEKEEIDYIYFMLYKPSVDQQNNYNGPTVKELADACSTVYKVFKNSRIRIKFEMSIPICLIEKHMLSSMIENEMISTCCHISRGSGIIFDTDFNILPCNHFLNYPLNKKNVQEDKIEEFWNSKQCNKFRKIIKTYPTKKCQKCSKWIICGGGCALRWLKNDPNEIINEVETKW